MTTAIHIDINTGENLALTDYPAFAIHERTCKAIVATTLSKVAAEHAHLRNKSISISLYLVESSEGQRLNHEYRNKDYATNVLSFPSDLPADIRAAMDECPLGELILCLPVVAREANEQKKTPQHHLSHLLVHGCLHLLGYDHELSDTVTEADANEMEAIEIDVLAELGIENPYL